MTNQGDYDVKPPTSDDAVSKRTGKTWKEWFSILDAAGARDMDHKQIVAYLNKNHEISAWWQQSVTVAYEQARGMRQKHQKPDGYQVSASKTVPVSLSQLYEAWSDEEQRLRWLPVQGLVIRKATRDKSLRIEWEQPPSKLDINFYEKGDDKSQVNLQHSGLPDSELAEQIKAYWRDTLKQMEAFLK